MKIALAGGGAFGEKHLDALKHIAATAATGDYTDMDFIQPAELK